MCMHQIEYIYILYIFSLVCIDIYLYDMVFISDGKSEAGAQICCLKLNNIDFYRFMFLWKHFDYFGSSYWFTTSLWTFVFLYIRIFVVLWSRPSFYFNLVHLSLFCLSVCLTLSSSSNYFANMDSLSLFISIKAKAWLLFFHKCLSGPWC